MFRIAIFLLEVTGQGEVTVRFGYIRFELQYSAVVLLRYRPIPGCGGPRRFLRVKGKWIGCGYLSIGCVCKQNQAKDASHRPPGKRVSGTISTIRIHRESLSGSDARLRAVGQL